MAQLLEEHLRHQKYRRKHLRLGKENPYQLMLGDTPIDFLADANDCATIGKRVLGRGILLNASTGYDFLLTRTITVNCANQDVRVPHPARYIIHKTSVYLENPALRAHDIAIAYYTLSRSPLQNEILEEIERLKKTAICRFVGNELPKHCENKSAPACYAIQKFLLEVGIQEASETVFDYLQKIVSALKI